MSRCERCGSKECCGADYGQELADCDATVDKLRAELAELRADNAKHVEFQDVYRARNLELRAGWDRCSDELAAERHKVAELHEAIERLKDYADDANSGYLYIERTHGRLYGVGFDRVFEKYAALAAAEGAKT